LGTRLEVTDKGTHEGGYFRRTERVEHCLHYDLRHIYIHLPGDSALESKRIISDELKVVEQFYHSLKGTHEAELILVDSLGSGGHLCLGLGSLGLLVHVCLLLGTLVAIKIDECIVHIFLLEVIMKGSELSGRGKQFCGNLGVGLLGFIQLLLKVELFPVYFQYLSRRDPVYIELVQVIGALDSTIEFLKDGVFAVLELQYYPLLYAQLGLLSCTVLLVDLHSRIYLVNQEHLHHSVDVSPLDP
jgi:hypothetical protein